MARIEIYLSDLLPEKQKEILETLGLNTVEESNYDIIPLAVLEVEEVKNG